MNQQALSTILKKWTNKTDTSDITIEDLLLHIAHEVARLLIENPNRLRTALYQIDVNETLVGEIFRTSLDRDVPLKIANLILRRELQRLSERS